MASYCGAMLSSPGTKPLTESGDFSVKMLDGLHRFAERKLSESIKNRGNLGLVENSSCHSMWIISRTGRRDGYDLFVIDQAGNQTDNNWGQEAALDVEWAHAIAPGAGILVVEAAPGYDNDQAFQNLIMRELPSFGS